MSNGLIESTNTKIRVITRMAYGFTERNTSSPSPCSPSADTAHPYPAETDPQISHKSPITPRS
jgi:hypothetical protein